MSVIMAVVVNGDSKKLEQYTTSESATVQAVLTSAKEHGLIAHRFYGSGDQVMVMDEWPDEQSFQSFFEENDEKIGPMFQAAGANPSEVQPRFWRQLETSDQYGWGA
jgi:heme-degrading monooxygenase HmoA